MTRQFVWTIIFATIFLLTSCGKSERQIEEKKEKILWQKIEQLRVTNKKAITELSQKFNSISGWDTLAAFTYVLQEMFVDERKPISFEGELKDITKLDSTYFLRVHSDWYYKQNYIAQISISPEKFIELKNQLKSSNHSKEGCFIFKVSKIIYVSPEIKSNSESEGEAWDSYLDYDFNKSLLIFKGDLIDFYLNEIVEKTIK